SVVPKGVAVESAESGAVISGGGCVEIKNLRKAVRTRIRNAGGAERLHDRDGGEAENDEGHDEDGGHGHFHVGGFDFFAEIFGSATDHQTGDENGKDDKNDHAVEAGADTTEDHFAEHDVDERNEAAERRE